jgi:hypothetical protein
MFQMHNETINVWSHLFGAMLFISLIFYVKDSHAFERPRAIMQSVVDRIPFHINLNASILEHEFCGPDDDYGGWNASNHSGKTWNRSQQALEDAVLLNASEAAEAARSRKLTCKRRNEQLAFSFARRHFAAAKTILEHVEFKLPGLERWRDLVLSKDIMVGRSVANEVQHVQVKLDIPWTLSHMPQPKL